MKKAVCFACLGAIFIATGIFYGEISTVITKAITICMECVGIG